MLRMTSLFEAEEFAGASWLMSFRRKTPRSSQIYPTYSPARRSAPCHITVFSSLSLVVSHCSNAKPAIYNLKIDTHHRRSMVSRDYIFWEVDVQRDFMLPGGNLYVPGAEKLLSNIRRLTDPARLGKVFLVSHGCFHTPNDPEFKTFPPHCVKGTPGAELVPEALTAKVARVPNDASATLPKDLSQYQQILLEKQT